MELQFNRGETRPIILNGIAHFVHRLDLADRALFISLQAIAPEHRRTEAELICDFDKAQPGLFGALRDLVSLAQPRLPETSLDVLPRMADFARWSEAWAAEVYGLGVFLFAYEANRQGSVDALLDTNPVAFAILALMEGGTRWSGAAS